MRFLLLLVALAPLVMAAIEFTGPDASSKLNLSAPITISWESFGRRNDNWTMFDLTWHGDMADGPGAFGYTIAENLTVSSGEYEWDPTNETESLENAGTRLSEDKAFYFEGFRHGNNSGAGEGSTGEKFAVEGYELMGSSGNSLKPTMPILVAGIAAAGIWLI